MLNRLLTLIVVIEIIALLIVKTSKEKDITYNYSINTYKVSDINKVKLENYVIGVVAAEMPATFSLESLKAQAVAARTFAYKKIINNKLTFDNLVSDKGQSYISQETMKNKWENKYDEYYEKISNAVLSTKGEVITYNGEVINSYYFSLSNGKTEDSRNVFGELKYLISVESPWDKNVNSYSYEISYSLEDFKSKLNIDENIEINEIKRTSTDHVDYIVINNRRYSGVDFRKLLNLRSTDFILDIDNNGVKIITRGYGHGVGMSQYGANAMAKEGKNYKEILQYYYKDVSFMKI